MSTEASRDTFEEKQEQPWFFQENERLLGESRGLLNALWLEVCRTDEAVFSARRSLITSRQSAWRSGHHRPSGVSWPLAPRFAEAQAVSLLHEFEPESWLCGIVVAHRWHDHKASAHGENYPTGWIYEVQMGDPGDLFMVWVAEGELLPSPGARAVLTAPRIGHPF